jgi:hypothetical protein
LFRSYGCRLSAIILFPDARHSHLVQYVKFSNFSKFVRTVFY